MADDLFGTNAKPVLSRAGKARYGRPLEELAKIYGQTDRTIKRWIRTGKQAAAGSDLPPLENPVEMPAWWARHYKHRCPGEILEAARSSAPVKPSASPLPPLPPDHGLQVGTGFEDMLRRVRDAEAEASTEYLRIMKVNPDDPRLASARKSWQELAKQLRELERDAHEILSKTGQVAQKSVVEALLAELHQPIVMGIQSLWPRLKSRLRSVSDLESDRIWQEAVSTLFRRLNESSFLAHE